VEVGKGEWVTCPNCGLRSILPRSACPECRQDFPEPLAAKQPMHLRVSRMVPHTFMVREVPPRLSTFSFRPMEIVAQTPHELILANSGRLIWKILPLLVVGGCIAALGLSPSWDLDGIWAVFMRFCAVVAIVGGLFTAFYHRRIAINFLTGELTEEETIPGLYHKAQHLPLDRVSFIEVRYTPESSGMGGGHDLWTLYMVERNGKQIALKESGDLDDIKTLAHQLVKLTGKALYES